MAILDTTVTPSLTFEEVLADGSTISTPAADTRRLFLGEDGLFHMKDAAGAVTDVGAPPPPLTEITSIPTAEVDDTLVLAPDGAGGVEFRAETGGGGGGSSWPPVESLPLHGTYGDDFGTSTLDAKWNIRGPRAQSIIPWNGACHFPGYTGGAVASIDEAWAPTTEAEFIASFNLNQFGSQTGDIGVGVFCVNSSGTGIIARVIGNAATFGLFDMTTWTPGTTARATQVMLAGINSLGLSRFWIRLVKRSGIWFADFSGDGENWLFRTFGYEDAFTPARIGVAKYSNAALQHDLWVPRFNVVNDFGVGNNLVRTPTSGTATYTASSSFSASFTPDKAADGGMSDGWACNGTADNPLYWQVAWSVAQSLNRVRMKTRPGTANFSGGAHLEFSDGSAVPIAQSMYGSGLWLDVYFPTKSGITTMRLVANATGEANAGMTEIEAYLAS